MKDLPEQIGRYQILGLLGTGGMAEVLLARRNGPSGFERPVVIKRILPHLARQARFRAMFTDEARIVAGIRHQNVVHVHDFDREGDELYLVMEYLEGESASSLARRLAASRKLLGFGLCAHIMSEVAAGLHAAHDMKSVDGRSQGLVHRDVSPANVFLSYDGGVKIIDFGIAVAEDRESKTEAGQVKGKYAYMSPEQCRGEPLDRRSDVFAMGTVLYEVSTCRRLFKRPSDMLTLQAVCSEAALPPTQLYPEYPPELEAVVLKALNKRREDRYQSALEMRRDLVEVARKLNGSKIPEESLAKVMRRLFPDRIEEKRKMLARLRAGEQLTEVPAADIEDSVELAGVHLGPSTDVSMMQSQTMAANSPLRMGSHSRSGYGMAFEPSSGGSSSWHSGAHTGPVEPSALPSSGRRQALLIGAAAATLFMVGGTLALTTMNAGPADAEEPPAEPAKVELAVQTDPPGASVHFEGKRVEGTTPLTIEVERSAGRRRLELSLEGHSSVVEVVTPDRDQRFRLVLPRIPEPEPKPEAVEVAERRAVRRPARVAEPKEPAKPAPSKPRPKPAKEESDNPYSRFK